MTLNIFLISLLLIAIAAYLFCSWKRRTYARENGSLKQIIADLDEEMVTLKKKLEVSRVNLLHQTSFQQKLIDEISHDLKAPLKFLMITARGMHTELDSMSKEELCENIKAIHSFSFRLYHSVEDLSNYSRIFIREEASVKTTFSLPGLISDLLSQFEDLFEDQDTRVEFIPEPTTDILSSKLLLTVIIHNLLNYLSPFSKNGLIALTLRQNDNQYIITFQISETRDEFVTNPEEHNPGMLLAYELVKFVGGELREENNVPGIGSRLSLMLRSDPA